MRIDVINQDDPTQVTNRVFARTFSTQVDWSTSFGLPTLLPTTLKLSPGISLQNVDSHSFWVRTEQTGGRYVHQAKRPSYSLSAAPTFFGLFPGIFGVSRFRHSISPSITYSYSPAQTVGKDFLSALNINPRGYLGSLASNAITLNIAQTFEAKMKSKDTTGTAEPRKVKILGIGMSPLSYDFERKRKTGRSGFTNDAFGYDVNSDLLPGFRLGVQYSLFQGNPLSDSSRFKPFRTRVDASFNINGNSGIFGALSRVFGKAIPNTSPQTETLAQGADDALAQRVASTPGGRQRKSKQSLCNSSNAGVAGVVHVQLDAPAAADWKRRDHRAGSAAGLPGSHQQSSSLTTSASCSSRQSRQRRLRSAASPTERLSFVFRRKRTSRHR